MLSLHSESVTLVDKLLIISGSLTDVSNAVLE